MKAMKVGLAFWILVSWAGGPWADAASAGPASLAGGRQMPVGLAHQLGLGWPGLSYEYWHSGAPDWAVGGEVVFGDWSAGFSDMEIAGAVNVPLRWHLGEAAGAEFSFQVKPGLLLGNMDVGRDDRFVFGVRSEFSLPVSVELTPRVNLVTGGSIPLSVFFVDGAEDYVVLPLLARLGAEVKATEKITPWLLFELGPAMAFGDFDTETEFAFRVWVGSTFR